ncbi:FtsL-like putative cell division protein [Hymenobacter yonginensis]|uniref:FtsL-like putative cell division protein n=1 Tax=Hymenobacter yonginensis TaxID=748197 RepID=A0ABY7PQR0_9BACT|nr:FtsL-like putative cell division protein [Hymenobacter yonginensis]WBO85271.1 FtsL-like putative cell division protein [Hymenobacter yonginensis]
MAINTIKPAASQPRANVPRHVEPEPVPTPEPASARPAEPAPRAPKAAKAPRPAAPRNSWSVFSLLERLTRMDGLFREGLPVRYLPHVLFVMLLILIYIGNTHYATRMNRSIQRLKIEAEDLRADYTTLKSDYMEASKQSEVARKVAAYGLVESSSPPFRIEVPAGRLDEAALDLVPVLTADSLAARTLRDSLRRAGPVGPIDSMSIEVGAPPVPIGTDATGEPAMPEPTTPRRR